MNLTASRPVGRLVPWQPALVPACGSLLTLIGPGLVWASLSQSSGELIWWPYLTVKYRDAFLWLILPSLMLQFFVNQEIGRYTLTTGETILTGFARLGRGYAFLIWALLFATSLWLGSYALAGGTALASLTGFPPQWTPQQQSLFWGYLTMFIFLLGLLFSGVLYQLLENLMRVVLAVTFLGIFFSVIQPQVLAEVGEFLPALVTPHLGWPANWDPRDLDALVTGIAYAGAGGFFNLMYSYWLSEKNVGLAAYVGHVTSPIAGKAEPIPLSGFYFEDTAVNESRYRQWLRFLAWDNGIGVGLTGLTLVLLVLLSWTWLMPLGTVPAGWQIAVVQAEFFRSSMGFVGGLIFLFAAAMFLSDTWVGAVDATARMHGNFFLANFTWARRWHYRTWYYICLGLLILLTAATMTAWQPGQLLLIGGVLNLISMALYIPALIYLNYVLIPRTFPAWTRPGRGWLVAIGLAELFYLFLAVGYLYTRFWPGH